MKSEVDYIISKFTKNIKTWSEHIDEKIDDLDEATETMEDTIKACDELNLGLNSVDVLTEELKVVNNTAADMKKVKEIFETTLAKYLDLDEFKLVLKTEFQNAFDKNGFKNDMIEMMFDSIFDIDEDDDENYKKLKRPPKKILCNYDTEEED